jgi:transposase
MKLDLICELKKIIYNTNDLKGTFSKIHPNTKYTLDNILNEILYFLNSGVSWNYLRSTIKPKTLYWHYSRFVKYNVFGRLLSKLQTKYIKKTNTNNINLLIDASIVYNKNGVNKLGRNKFYKNKRTTKISLMTDTNGFPLSVLFMKGNYHDNKVFNKHVTNCINLTRFDNKKIIADKGYSSHKNYELLDKNNIKHIIPPRKNMKMYSSYVYSQKEYAKRIKIENIFALLKNYKRINNRYDKLLRTYISFVYLALIKISINIINKQ